MRILAFSDLHCDLEQGRRLCELAEGADLVIGAGDFASVHEGLEATIEVLAEIDRPSLLVPGNNETEAALREACAGWSVATILHGQSTEVAGVGFFGLGAGIPVTPWDWSFDLDDEAAARALDELSSDDFLILHSPPRGHADLGSSGDHLGSPAIATAIERAQPRYAVCGHIHEAWGSESSIGSTTVRNLGPAGTFIEL